MYAPFIILGTTEARGCFSPGLPVVRTIKYCFEKKSYPAVDNHPSCAQSGENNHRCLYKFFMLFNNVRVELFKHFALKMICGKKYAVFKFLS